jgi:hypothetical protein
MTNRCLWTYGGIAGVLGVSSYVAAIMLPWPEGQAGTTGGLLVASAWPVLSVIYSYALYSFIAAERDGHVNRIGFVFAALAFATVLAMIVVQMAVHASVGDVTRGLDDATAHALERGLRMIDLGLDVTWDILIGAALVFSGIAMRRRGGLGHGWAVPSIVLGVALVALNAATFPWPPGDHGLVDIGPLVGLFVAALSIRLIVLGRRAGANA